MQASVPEFTNLILSILGTILTHNFAILVSNSVGIPKEVPKSILFLTEFKIFSFECPKIIGPQLEIKSIY